MQDTGAPRFIPFPMISSSSLFPQVELLIGLKLVLLHKKKRNKWIIFVTSVMSLAPCLLSIKCMKSESENIQIYSSTLAFKYSVSIVTM